MTLQFIREAKLFVLILSPTTDANTANQQTWDLSNLRFKFEVFAADLSAPNYAVIKVYNLSNNTAQQILHPDFPKYSLQVKLIAGYNGNAGQIFAGSVREVYQGRESATDTYICIVAADGDMFYNHAIVSTTLAAEANNAQGRLDAIVKSSNQSIERFSPQGTESGVTVAYASDTVIGKSFLAPRGKVLFGSVRRHLDGWAITQGSNWSIQNGKLVLIANNEYRPGLTFKLNSTTGMIGIPQQTSDGIKIRCLINPSIISGGQVEINNKDITPAQLTAEGFLSKAGDNLPLISSDGIYRVYVVEYIGDTRGLDWYADLTCLAINRDTQKVQDTSGTN